jgi:hypothetical protein
MYSIYHFFKTLVDKKSFLLESDKKSDKKLEDFPFDSGMFSCKNTGIFPDLAIRLNPQNHLFTGGELIELKDSKSYTVASFNSTIPSGKKEISKLIKGEHGTIQSQMEAVGDDIFSQPIREVYYLVRGRKNNNIEVLLVHGSFFETIQTSDLISQSFAQILEERLQQSELEGHQIAEMKQLLVTLFSEQAPFSKVRSVDKASVKLRFRIMTEVTAEANILNSEKYPEIIDNTINFVLPCHTESDSEIILQRMRNVFAEKIDTFEQFKLKHHFNGYFLVFQICL